MRIGIFKIALVLSAILTLPEGVKADKDDTRYERVSLCQFMVSYPHKTYFRELEHEYKSIPLSNHMNDHNLGVNFIKFASDDLSAKQRIDYFLSDAQVAKKMVAKWFSYNKETGTFDMSLIQRRGCYNATMNDARVARKMLRGEAYLADGGERLLNYSFVAVHDFVPMDKELTKKLSFNKKSNISGDDIINLNDSITLSEYNRQYHSGDTRRNSYELMCNTYLYKLVWNEETAGKFYDTMYIENPDSDKSALFKDDTSTFRLEYVGSSSQQYKQRRDRRIKSNEDLVKTAMARIMDMNIASLQDICPDFRIKTDLRMDGDIIFAEIGLKENVRDNDIFEVLEREEDEEGNVKYNVIGNIRPVKGHIWDNRFNAYDSDGRDDNGSYYTIFDKISGEDFYEGLIIRKKSLER